MKLIEITISLEGQTRLETRGFHGATCQEASRLLERALGNTTAEQLTSEYHQSTVQTDLPQLE